MQEVFTGKCPECQADIVYTKGQLTRLDYPENEQPFYAVCGCCNSWIEGTVGQLEKANCLDKRE